MGKQENLEAFRQMKQRDNVANFTEEAFTQPGKSFVAGVGHMLGLPGTLGDVIAGGDQPFAWSGEDYQRWMADQGITYTPEETPDTISSRAYEMLGESVIPMGGIAAKTGKYTSNIVPEVIASITGATGGKILKGTEWGQEHPQWAQLLGELGGGLGGPSAIYGAPKLVKAGAKTVPLPYKAGKYVYKKGKDYFQHTYQGEGAKTRATTRADELFDDPYGSIARMEEMQGGVEGDILSPAQKTRSEGPLRLSKTAEKEYPAIARAHKKQRSLANQKLQQKVLRTGNPDDARVYLDRELREMAEDVEEKIAQIDQADDPAKISTKIVDNMYSKYSESRHLESKIWENLPESEASIPNNLIQKYKKEFNNITRGGDINEIDEFVRTKLGKVNKKGNLSGGKFINQKQQTATAKELHQFYSRIGRKMAELARQGGQWNKVRILKELRGAVLDDLDVMAVGEDYRKALNFSRDLNEKFTEGQVGKMLGLSRGEAPSATRAMDDFLSINGQEAKENIDQALKANPEIINDVENFIKGKFALVAKNINNNKINVKAAEKFINKYGKLLDEFPGLKTTLKNATKSQKNVDDLLGVKGIDEASPLVTQKSAAAMYLEGDPGQEIGRILNNKKIRTKALRELIKKVKQDPTRKAIRGLKNTFGQELVNYSKMGIIDEMTGENFVSGSKMLKRLNELKKPLLESGFLTQKEFQHYKKIANAFRGVEMDIGTEPLSGEMIGDIASQLLRTPARIFAARAAGKFSAESAGGSIQSANIAAGRADEFVKGLGKDQAKNILISAVNSDDQMKLLLTDVTKLKPEQRVSLWNKIINKAKKSTLGSIEKMRGAMGKQRPATAVTPPLIESAQMEKEKTEQQRRLDEFREFKETPVQ